MFQTKKVGKNNVSSFSLSLTAEKKKPWTTLHGCGCVCLIKTKKRDWESDEEEREEKEKRERERDWERGKK